MFLSVNGVLGGNSFENNSNNWKTSVFFVTMLPILFAFDGFIYTATLQKDVEYKKVVAPVMFTAIIAVSIFYLIISAAIFFGANDGNIFALFDNLTANNLGKLKIY